MAATTSLICFFSRMGGANMPDMTTHFKLRFDRSQISHWGSRYSYSTMDVSESVVENEIGNYAKKNGHLTKEYLVKIGYWKSPRSTKRCQSNDDAFIRAVTATAL